MFARVLRFMLFAGYFACAVPATESENVNLDLDSLDYNRSHILTRHILCPPDVGKVSNVRYDEADDEYLHYNGQDGAAITVQCVEIPNDYVIAFAQGVREKRFEIKAVLTDPAGFVFPKKEYSSANAQKRLWNGVYQMIKGSISEIVKVDLNDNAVLYNIKLTNPIKVHTFMAVRGSGKKKQKLFWCVCQGS